MKKISEENNKVVYSYDSANERSVHITKMCRRHKYICSGFANDNGLLTATFETKKK